MIFKPFARFVTKGLSDVAGVGSSLLIFSAHGGNFTFAFLVEMSDSPPPKLFDEIGLSDGTGVRIAEIARSKSRYSLATRLTSSTVTARNKFTSSSGELRFSIAMAVDHADAKPSTEFFCNSAFKISRRFAASIKSELNPLVISDARISLTL